MSPICLFGLFFLGSMLPRPTLFSACFIFRFSYIYYFHLSTPTNAPTITPIRLQASSLHVVTGKEEMWSALTFLLALAINLSDIAASGESEKEGGRVYL